MERTAPNGFRADCKSICFPNQNSCCWRSWICETARRESSTDPMIILSKSFPQREPLCPYPKGCARSRLQTAVCGRRYDHSLYSIARTTRLEDSSRDKIMGDQFFPFSGGRGSECGLNTSISMPCASIHREGNGEYSLKAYAKQQG